MYKRADYATYCIYRSHSHNILYFQARKKTWQRTSISIFKQRLLHFSYLPTFYHAYMVDHTRIGCLMAAVGLSFIGYENTLIMVYQHFHLVEVWQLLNLPLQSGVSSWVFFNSFSLLNPLRDFNTSSISWPCTYRHPAYEAMTWLSCLLCLCGKHYPWPVLQPQSSN